MLKYNRIDNSSEDFKYWL